MVRTLDDYELVLRAAKHPWPEPIEKLSVVGQSIMRRPPYDRSFLDATARAWARLAQTLRCARLRLDGSLELIDPFTGRPLQLVNCKL